VDDPAYRNAIRRRNAVAAEISQAQQRLEELRSEISRIDRFIEEWHNFAGAPEQTENSCIPVDSGDKGSVLEQVERPRNPRKEDVAEAARAIIQERGSPIMRGELFQLLKERGVQIYGKDPEMVLSTMLWRMRGRVVRVPTGGYWLAEQAHPGSGYDPRTTSKVSQILSTLANEIAEPLPEEREDIEREMKQDALFR
jgi:hypothetical protein